MPTHVMDGLYQIEIPTPFKVGPVNCYVTTTEPITLIDTGTQGAESRAALQAELAALGLQVSDLCRVIITHAHADHYGQAAEIVRASNAEVWTHRHNRVQLEAYESIRKVVRQRIHFHERRAQRILDMIGAEDRSAYQISKPLFGRLSGTEAFLALSETIGHLDWLEEQGRIEAIQNDEVIYWKRQLGLGG